jgi:hypothetical protein
VLRTDTGNFNRFLTSLGLLLLAAALVIPYFYFRNTEILTIPESDLRSMTPTARSALGGRQDAIATLEPWVVGGAIALALGGAVLVVAGGLRLRAAQESEDEETELRKDRARLELDEMSPAEKAEQVAEKAKEETAREEGDAVAPREAVAATAPWSRRAAITRISDRVRAAFGDGDLPTHQLKWQVRIGTATDAVRMDGVFESSREGRPDVLLETRLASDPSFLPKIGRNAANELIAKTARYRAITRRSAKGWLVFVIPRESGVELSPDELDRHRRDLRNAIGEFGAIALLPEEEIDSLPTAFTSEFAEPVASGGWW